MIACGHCQYSRFGHRATIKKQSGRSHPDRGRRGRSQDTTERAERTAHETDEIYAPPRIWDKGIHRITLRSAAHAYGLRMRGTQVDADELGGATMVVALRAGGKVQNKTAAPHSGPPIQEAVCEDEIRVISTDDKKDAGEKEGRERRKKSNTHCNPSRSTFQQTEEVHRGLGEDDLLEERGVEGRECGDHGDDDTAHGGVARNAPIDRRMNSVTSGRATKEDGGGAEKGETRTCHTNRNDSGDVVGGDGVGDGVGLERAALYTGGGGGATQRADAAIAEIRCWTKEGSNVSQRKTQKETASTHVIGGNPIASTGAVHA
ncbi:hypothetical protein B0H16DRAFT_1472473 [Mycena metata]|uniref:Uncharacterized protein n=1 Tax=Mycena metata TaxID=1033252 RepID=A0AAD7MMD0_9AGAR|nr:hypothetical protein B0H16DRAFT_1472473 [Mycena metata]